MARVPYSLQKTLISDQAH